MVALRLEHRDGVPHDAQRRDFTINALFLDPNPAPAKYAASLLGFCENELRLPLVPTSAGTEEKVRSAMQHAGLLN